MQVFQFPQVTVLFLGSSFQSLQVAMQLQNEATWSTPHCLLVPGLPISQKAVKNVDSGKAREQG